MQTAITPKSREVSARKRDINTVGIQRRERILIRRIRKNEMLEGSNGLVRFEQGKNGTIGGEKPQRVCLLPGKGMSLAEK